MEEKTAVEKAAMLGLIMLLGATSDLLTAVTATLIISLCAAVIGVLCRCLQNLRNDLEHVYWAILLSASFAVSWFLSELLFFIVPVRESALIFLRLAGVMPIVLYSAGRDVRIREAIELHIHFVVLILIIGVVRELVGRGTVGGCILPVIGYTVPLSLFASPAGAFFMVGTVILLSRIGFRYRMKQEGKQ